MKTLVVIDCPDGLYRLLLSDLAGPPVKGGCYARGDGKCFEVVETIEFLGNRGSNGLTMAGSQQLIAVLKAVFGGDDATVAARMAGMKDAGSCTTMTEGRTAGGILTATTSLTAAEDYDHVLFVRTEPKQFAQIQVSAGGGSFRPLRLVGAAPDEDGATHSAGGGDSAADSSRAKAS